MGGGEAVRCSGRGAINVAASLSSSDATAMTRGVVRVGGGIAIAATSRASWFRFRRANDASRSFSTPRVVPRAGGVAAIADVSGDDAAPAAEEENAGAGEEVEINHWKNAMPANDAIDKQILKLFVLHVELRPSLWWAPSMCFGLVAWAVPSPWPPRRRQPGVPERILDHLLHAERTAPVVAKAAASGDTEEVQRVVGEAVFVASFVGLRSGALDMWVVIYLCMYVFFSQPLRIIRQKVCLLFSHSVFFQNRMFHHIPSPPPNKKHFSLLST